MLYGDTQLTGVERIFNKSDIIVSKTDLAGKVTYGNRQFYSTSGYEEHEVLGVQHNLIRHPEMPRAVFELLWSTLKEGKEIFAYVINRAKNGDHYWVFAHVTPSFDMSGNITGYHSNRRVPNRKVIQEHIEPLYKKLLKIEHSASSPKLGMQKSLQATLDLLKQRNIEYSEFIFSLGI